MQAWWASNWPRIKKRLIWFFRALPQLLILAGTICLAVSSAPSVILGRKAATDSDAHDLLPGHWGWTQGFFFAGISLVVAGTVWQLISANSVQNLRGKLGIVIGERDTARQSARGRAAALESVLRAILMGLANEMSLYSTTARLSVYCHIDNEFVLLSRVSDDPNLALPGRPSYPETEGSIGKAWSKGWAFVTGMSDIRSEWEQELITDHEVPLEVAANMRMQSRSLLGLRINATIGGSSEPIGVVILESETARGIVSSMRESTKTKLSWQLLENAMSNAKEQFPEVAKERLVL